jgi:hypothetical protein
MFCLVAGTKGLSGPSAQGELRSKRDAVPAIWAWSAPVRQLSRPAREENVMKLMVRLAAVSALTLTGFALPSVTGASAAPRPAASGTQLWAARYN